MAFRVGQKVVCIHAGPRPGYVRLATDTLCVGSIYTVAAVDATHLGNPGVAIHEVPRPMGLMFGQWRFRPAVERKTDISIFTRMLTDKTVETV